MKSCPCCSLQERELDYSQPLPLLNNFEASCSHEPKANRGVTIVVNDENVTLTASNVQLCLACLEEYFQHACAICAKCLKLIVPGTQVGKAPDGASHPYTHLDVGCCLTASLHCGTWADGYIQER